MIYSAREPSHWRRFWRKVLRRDWSPFDRHGRLDTERLKKEGWWMLGSIRDE